jgi:hypothetical protein
MNTIRISHTPYKCDNIDIIEITPINRVYTDINSTRPAGSAFNQKLMALLARTIANANACFAIKTVQKLFLAEKERRVDRHGLSFIFHYFDPEVYPALETAPPARYDPEHDPLLPPYPIHREVAHLENGADHFVFVNYKMIVIGHVVISCAARTATQGDPLDLSDCCALAQVWQGFGRRGLLYYNAGVDSGCSQLHKHMQFAPLEECPLADAMRKGEKLPYRYYAAEVDLESGEAIFEVYERLMKEANWSGDYNCVLTNGLIAIVPRRVAIPNGIIVNGVGVVGHYMLWEGQNLDVEEEPIEILKAACVPW